MCTQGLYVVFTYIKVILAAVLHTFYKWLSNSSVPQFTTVKLFWDSKKYFVGIATGVIGTGTNKTNLFRRHHEGSTTVCLRNIIK